MEYIAVNREGIDLSALEEGDMMEQGAKRRRIGDAIQELKERADIEPSREEDKAIDQARDEAIDQVRKRRLLIMKIRSYQQRFEGRIKDLEIPENLHDMDMEALEALAEDIHITLAGHTNMGMMEKMFFGGTKLLEDFSCRAGFDVRGLSVDLACDPKSRDVLDVFLIDNMDLFVVQPRTALMMTVGSLWMQRYKINKDAEYAVRLLEVTIDEKEFEQYDDI